MKEALFLSATDAARTLSRKEIASRELTEMLLVLAQAGATVVEGRHGDRVRRVARRRCRRIRTPTRLTPVAV
jgi:hypothetical protein